MKCPFCENEAHLCHYCVECGIVMTPPIDKERDAKTLLAEAQSVKTDDERVQWIESLTPKERELLGQQMRTIMEMAREFMTIFQQVLVARLDALISHLAPIMSKIEAEM